MRIALTRGNCNFDGVLQDKWGNAETATSVHNYGYMHAMGIGMSRGVLRVGTQTYVRV